MAVLGSYYGGGAPTNFESTDNLEGLNSSAIGAGIGAIVGGMVGSLIGGDNYDAYKDYLMAVAKGDAQIPEDQLAELSKEDLLGKILVAGWVPIFCEDSEIARNNILREFANRGWQGKGWWQRYHKGLGQYTHWYGVTLNFANAPQAIVRQATLDGTKANNLLTKAKTWMRPQGTENYDQMIRLAAGSVVLAQRAAAPPPAPTTPAGESQMGGPARRPWYKKWWVWALVGGVTVTAGIGGYMLIRRLRRKRTAVPAAVPALPATTQGFGRWPSE